MTYIVSSGALNSTPTNNILNLIHMGAAAVCLMASSIVALIVAAHSV